jgi:hypothetical protein
MEQVMGGITRFLGSVKVQSIDRDIELNTAGPATLVLINSTEKAVSVSLPPPARSAGGTLTIRVGGKTQIVINEHTTAPGCTVCLACDGTAWYKVWTLSDQVPSERTNHNGSIPFDLKPGILDIQETVEASWLTKGHSIQLTMTFLTESAEGILCALPPVVVGRKDGVGFTVCARLKSLRDEPVHGFIAWNSQ